MATNEEFFRGWVNDLEHQLEKIQLAIYGDKKAPPNGGGVYGEMRRIREEIRSDAQDRKLVMAEWERRLDEMEERIQAQDRKQERLFYLVGVGFGLLLVLQISHILMLL